MKRLSLFLILFVGLTVVTVVGQEQVYRSVEQMPQFPGGEAALMKYIDSQVQIPQIAEKITNGRVVVQFVVQSDGSIGEVKVVRSVHPDYDQEAVRVVKSLPKFTPGRQDGKAVAVWYTLPVLFRDKESGAGFGFMTKPRFDTHSDSTIYRSVEQMPQFPGGEAALMKYIKAHLQTPQTSENIRGNVILQFVVQSDGSIGEVKVVRSVHPDYDQEAVRIVKSLPNFEPGRQDGKAVAVWYTLPVVFR